MIGTTLAHYEITALIGKGGMGEVYRARDTKLGREVAIKILPREMSGDPERIARFEREAKTLASLHHPNIASIHGYEDAGSVRFLAMELVDGVDLATRMKSGPIPEDDAIEIVRHVAAGLAEAHRNAIVHRDLKPANVMLTADGDVKILDFGLARAIGGDAEDGSDPALSPTITAAMTQAGTILGTAAYMAPEQARGKKVDHRADIWAMGVILYEMLAGNRLYDGETTTDVLARVITVDPDLSTLPSGTSPRVRRMLRRCLQRDVRRRLDSAADAILELDDDVEPTVELETGASGGRSGLLPWVVVALVALGWIATAFWPGESGAPPEVRRYDLALSDAFGASEGLGVAVSPDGRWVAFDAQDSLGQRRILLRSLVDGSERWVGNDEFGAFPFWSPDTSHLAFHGIDGLRVLHLDSSSLQTLVEIPTASGRGGTWSADGKIVFAPSSNDPLWEVDVATGATRQVTTVDTLLVDGSHRFPDFLPDGRRFVYTLWSNVTDERAEHSGIFLGSLDGGPPVRLLRDASRGVVVPSGQLLFHRDGRLMAVDFDVDGGTVGGSPRLVSDSVDFVESNGYVAASVSDTGNLFFTMEGPERQDDIVRIDLESGRWETLHVNVPLSFGLALRPDGRYYLSVQLDDVGSTEVWVGNVERRTRSKLSRSDTDCWSARFSPDGREAMYTVQRSQGVEVLRQEIDGARPPRSVVVVDDLELGDSAIAQWFDDDLAFLVGRPDPARPLALWRLDPAEGTLEILLEEANGVTQPRLSPDGRWLAYVSEQSGRREVFVRSWPSLDRRWQVSRDGGFAPAWDREGNGLVYASATTRQVMRATVSVEADELRIGSPEPLWNRPQGLAFLDFSPDHDSVLAIVGRGLDAPPVVTILTGWAASR